MEFEAGSENLDFKFRAACGASHMAAISAIHKTIIALQGQLISSLLRLKEYYYLKNMILDH
jgi:hypothetical protein